MTQMEFYLLFVFFVVKFLYVELNVVQENFWIDRPIKTFIYFE